MKGINLLLFCLFISVYTRSQENIGVVGILSPVTGCVLTTSETVIVAVYNFGTVPIVSNMDVSYSINGGPPVTEIAPPTLNSGSSFTFTFLAKADLSAPGTYTITAYTSYPGDTNPGNDALDSLVNSDPLSAGGSISSDVTVCSGSNSGNLTLSGHIGSVLNWESTTNGGSSWNIISNTSATQNYTNLPSTTGYRALIQSGVCTAVYSSTVTITTDPVSVGGMVSPGTTVCSGINAGTLTVSAYTGDIINWELSTNSGGLWTPIVNTTSSQSYTNLTTTTWYRAQAKSGTCNPAVSSIATITVLAVPVGGSVVPVNATVCSGVDTGTLTLSGYSGNILQWEISTNNGGLWTPVFNASSTQDYDSITVTTWYRALVQDCLPPVYSSIAVVFVDPLVPIGGNVLSSTTVCAGTNAGSLTLSGYSGNVLNWESSTDGSVWIPFVNVTSSQNYSNLTETTWYRAQVENGVCAPATSSSATVTVNPVSVGGVVLSSTTVCSGSNNGSLTLAGYTGVVTNWESSTNGGSNWSTVANVTNVQSYNDLISTTIYRAIVKSGVCVAVYSNTVTVTVDSVSLGGIVSGNTTVCHGPNGGTLNLSAYRGGISNWEYSESNGNSWNTINNTTALYNYSNIDTITWYRAKVKNGVCSIDSSSIAIIAVYPHLVNAGMDVTIRQGSSVTLGGQGGTSYLWAPPVALSDPNITDPIANPDVTTVYTLTALDLNGCTDTDDIVIVVIPPFNYLIANLITLNEDGINDTWYIENIHQYPTSQISIYNSNGQEIYSASPYMNEWAGTYQGKKVPDGTYYYVLKFTDSDSVFKGAINIVSEKR